MSPARDERRQAVLGLLAQHGDIEWHGYGQDVAFADEVLELAARLGRVETVPALRPVRVATEKERKTRLVEIYAAIDATKRAKNVLSGPESDEQGEQVHGDGRAAQGNSAGESGGRA